MHRSANTFRTSSCRLRGALARTEEAAKQALLQRDPEATGRTARRALRAESAADAATEAARAAEGASRRFVDHEDELRSSTCSSTPRRVPSWRQTARTSLIACHLSMFRLRILNGALRSELEDVKERLGQALSDQRRLAVQVGEAPVAPA